MSLRSRPALLALVLATSASCSGSSADPDAGLDYARDASSVDASVADATSPDADPADAAGPPDGLLVDAGDPMLLSDDFDGTALGSDWLLFRPELLDISVADGELHLTPNQRALWFDANQGPLIYREITGNFHVTARIHTRLASDSNMEPVGDFHLGGLMARAPADLGAQENYVAILVGRDNNGIAVETKNTTNSITAWDGPDWATADAQVRICRVGEMFSTYKRAIGDSTWIQASNPTRADLPGTLQVGAVSYAPAKEPDVRASFEEIHFEQITAASECLD